MSIPLAYWARVDQLAAQAREQLDTTELTRPEVQTLFCDVFDFLNEPCDHVELKLRIFALGRLIQTIQEEPCPGPFSSGSGL